MSQSHAVAVDGSDVSWFPRHCVTNSVSDPASRCAACVRDGRLELVPEEMAAELVDCDGVLVITMAGGVVSLTRDDMRALLEASRR